MVYYNEIDPFAAQWLRNLIAAGLISDGDVDERSIEDITPQDLAGYIQCHFFAGIGVWSYALRQAGFSDDREVWTGSCPCQPFSVAGKGNGTADERHLWPAWFHLISQCKPKLIFGEQVEAAIRHGWVDLVQADLEGVGYACGFAGAPAAGFGAPHIRQRLWFVAQSSEQRCKGKHTLLQPGRSLQDRSEAAWSSAAGVVAHTNHEGPQGRGVRGGGPSERSVGESSVAGFWSDCDWIPCRDGKMRPVEPGTFPLAHGATQRVGRLRAYGNAIVAPVAQAFIESYLETLSQCNPGRVHQHEGGMMDEEKLKEFEAWRSQQDVWYWLAKAAWIEATRRSDRKAREECAKICSELRRDNYAGENEEWIAGADDCAKAIRATITEE